MLLSVEHPELLPHLRSLGYGLQPVFHPGRNEHLLIVKLPKEAILAARLNGEFKVYLLGDGGGQTSHLGFITAFFDDYDEPLVVKSPQFEGDELLKDLTSLLGQQQFDVYFFDEHDREMMGVRVDQPGWADYQLGDTESTLSGIQGLVAKLTVDTADANSRLRALFRQDEREDPVRKRARTAYVNKLIQQIRDDEALFTHVVAGGKLNPLKSQPADSDITDEDAKLLLEIATNQVHDRERDKMYQIVVKAPKSCSDAELDQFSAKVADGGEVADGV